MSDDGKHLSAPVIQVTTADRSEPVQEDLMPVTVILDNLRSAYNVGNIFRSAEATRVTEILTCGYTATPPHEKLQKTARGCDTIVPCRHFETAADAILDCRERGLLVFGVETVAGRTPVYWRAPVVFPCAMVFGNEALGISREALQLCDSFLRLPALGMKNSINVGNCAAVVLFDCVRRYAAIRRAKIREEQVYM